MNRPHAHLRRLSRAAWLVSAVVACLVGAGRVHAQLLLPEEPEVAQGAGVIEKLGETISMEHVLDGWDGKPHQISKYFNQGHKPVVLALIYFDCPIVCSLVMNRLADAIDALDDYTVGSDFNVMVVSFDPTEGPADAAKWRSTALVGYDRGVTPEVEAGWGFFTGSSAQVRPLADSVGFHYSRMPNGEFAHPTVFMVLTADGRVARYIHGFNYTPRDLKLALLEASEGKIAKTLGDWMIHKCYRYDPSAGAYTLQAMALMRIGGGLSVLAVGGLVAGLFVHERLRRRRATVNRSGDAAAQPSRASIAGASR
ncbi:MAG: SCO family protein [Phycisphaeraceae bacterium]|nr:MAG: SCO family protein [Phycisphaeraceae bacterium]